jgi:hypothetical protein
MNDTQKGLIAWAVILAVGIAAGLGIGWKLWRPKPGPVPTHQPAIQQADWSQVLEVKPDQHAKPPHQVPHGAVVEDVVHVTVQPNQPAVPPVSPHPSNSGASVPVEPAKPPCPPVRVDLSLLRMEDGTRRVVASSPDGQIVGAVHIPVEAAKPQPKVLKWAAGPSWNPADRTFGAWLERDAGPLRLGVDLHQVREPITAGGRVTWAGMIRAGIRF